MTGLVLACLLAGLYTAVEVFFSKQFLKGDWKMKLYGIAWVSQFIVYAWLVSFLEFYPTPG
jgi:hypothetical protein